MSEPQHNYPTAKPGEETVGDVLRQSTNKRTHLLAYMKSAHRVLPLQSDTVDFGEYLIRTSALYTGAHKQALQASLQATEDLALHVSDAFFVGPKVSQSLVELSGFEPRTGTDGRLLETVDLRVDIVPKHEGVTLNHYLRKHKQKGAEKIAEHFLAHPEALDALMEQAAFVGMQDRKRPTPDFNGRNMMVAEKADGSLEVSLIDVVPPEHSNEPDQYHETAKQWSTHDSLAHMTHEQIIGTHYVKGHGKSLRNLFTDFAEKLPANGASKAPFLSLVERSVEKVTERIENGTLTEDHPEWKGFTKVDDVAAIPLDAPSWVLKDALDTLYNKAVPEQAR